LYIFLGDVYATIIPSLAVPISIVGTFTLMYLLGFSLNNLSLMALTIATGFVVDDAIVMIENVVRYVENGEDPYRAALQGAKQIGFTIISLTVSLTAVLIPLLFMQDIIGRLFREFALTLMIAILISAFISLTFTPMLCARLLRKSPKKRYFQEKMIHYYNRSLQWVFANQVFILILLVLTILLTSFATYFISKEFFPIQDTGVIQGITQAPESSSFKAMSIYQQQLAKVVLQDPAVESLSSFIGIDGTNITLNSGRMLINLKPIADRNLSASDIIRRLQTKLNQVKNAKLYMLSVQDLSIETRVSPTQYQFGVGATNIEEVAKWSEVILKKLNGLEILNDVASNQQLLGLETLITINRDTASRLGINMTLIDNILYDAFGQRQISTMFTQRNQYHVILETLPELQQGPETLNHIYLNSNVNIGNNSTPQSGSVPLTSFSRISQQSGPLVITRQKQFPTATLSFNLAPDISLGYAINEINRVVDELNIPENVQTGFEGTGKIFEHSRSNQIWLILAAIFVVYIVLGVLYESFIHPLTILSTLPSATMGALLGLYLLNRPLSIIALIGIILLIGIVMKNAILMIDFALEQERLYGKTPIDAIHQAALLRFRPIIMTTMASLLGAVPLALSMGMGAELRQPLGIAIISGLIVSQLLTLYTTPVIYLSFDTLARRFGITSAINNPILNED
jgi:multidrug efflux pump